MTLTAKDVEEITRLLEQSNFDELYLELDGVKLSLRRGGGGVPAGTPERAPVAPTATRVAPSRAAPASSSQELPAQAAATAGDANIYEVPAPLLGTFYRAPKPGAPPFVVVGSTVEEGTIIGIIEVMKLMNSVRAEVKGTVVEILVEDGAAVEYGQVLLRVSRGDKGG